MVLSWSGSGSARNVLLRSGAVLSGSGNARNVLLRSGAVLSGSGSARNVVSYGIISPGIKDPDDDNAKFGILNLGRLVLKDLSHLESDLVATGSYDENKYFGVLNLKSLRLTGGELRFDFRTPESADNDLIDVDGELV